MAKTSRWQFLTTPEMEQAMCRAMAMDGRPNFAEWFREDLILPYLRERGLWPSTPGAEEPSRLVDTGVEVTE